MAVNIDSLTVETTLSGPAATTSVAGLMSASDKTKIDSVAASATNTPLASTTPAALGTAAVGVGTTAARADHVHAMPTATDVGAQPADSDLTAVAGLATTGLITRTGSGTAATRTITAGTSLGVANGDGVAGNPTVSHNNFGTAGTYGSASTVPVITTEATGHVTGVSATAISILAAAVTNFATTVLGTVLTGISFATGTAVLATDTILVAIGKLQAQINNGLTAALSGFTVGPNTPINNTDSILSALGKAQGQIDALIATDNEWFEAATTADIIISSNVTFTNVTELQFPVVSGRTYYIEVTVKYRCAATTTGIALSFGTPNSAAGDLALMVNAQIAADGTAAGYTGHITSTADVVTTTGVQTAQPTWFIANMKGSFVCTASGDLYPQFRSEVNGSNVNFGTGSYILVREFT